MIHEIDSGNIRECFFSIIVCVEKNVEDRLYRKIQNNIRNIILNRVSELFEVGNDLTKTCREKR